MAKAKTIRKQKFKSKAILRSESVKNGANKLLQLLQRAKMSDADDAISSVVYSPIAVELLLHKVG